MKLAEEFMEKKRWRSAVRECEKALELKPEDKRALELLAEARSHIEPPTITLDLGDGVTMEFVYIHPGEFMMGSPDTEPERAQSEGPLHRVRITKPFYMGKYEVTQAQYARIAGGARCYFKGANLPAEQVTWYDAAAFCKRLSEQSGRTARLPTEAEWEYACRAGTTTTCH